MSVTSRTRAVWIVAVVVASALGGSLGAAHTLALPPASPSGGSPSALPPALPTQPATPSSESFAPALEASEPTTISPGASSTSSDVIETPSPVIPSTSPTTFILATQTVNTTVTYNLSALSGPWALVLLNYTGGVVGGVYDSSFHASLDGVPVLFGTTPEQYEWTVLKDLTEYSALFEQPSTFVYNLGAATVGGHFVTSLSLSFYPVPASSPAPRTPSEVVPLWPFTAVTKTQPVVSANRSVPNDVVNATLELYSYGFSSGNGLDEFWYSTFPAYRAISVSVDGTPLATVQLFEYVNTGGLDLFLWDPVTGAYTVNDPPYEVDVTAALGLLEGAHQFNGTIVGIGGQSRWFVAGALFLYTDPSYGGATLTSAPAPSQGYSNATVQGNTTEHVSRSYSFQSTIPGPSGTETATSWTNESFDGVFPSDGCDVRSSTQFQERISSAAGMEWINATSRPSIEFHAVETSVITSTTGGGYPEYANVSYRMEDFHQNWNQSRFDTVAPNGSAPTVTGSYVNDNVTANGSYEGQEELISPGAAQITAIYWFWSNTSKHFQTLLESTPLVAWYRHVVTSALTPADLSTNLANVTGNLATFLDATALVLAHTPTDVGTSDTLTIRTLGFGGPYTYEWLDLPPGCSAPGPSEPVLTCAPNVNGSYLVSVSAIGRLGSVAFSPSVEWDVLAAPTATLEIDQAAIDLGGTAHLNVTFVGGEAPFRCGWTENGVPFGPLSRCATAVSLTPEALGEYRIVLNATDALGVAVGASPVRLEVTTLPGVVLLLVSPSASIPQVRVLTSIGLTTETSGGVAPFRFVWYEGSAIITSGASGGNLTYTPTSAGTKSITVQLTDADGNTVTSEAVLIDVISGSSGTNQTPTPSSSPALPTSALFVIGIVVLVALAAVLVLLIRRRGRPKEPPK